MPFAQEAIGKCFAINARWPVKQIVIRGRASSSVAEADNDNLVTYHSCFDSGSDAHYQTANKFEAFAIPLGVFEDPYFAEPAYSVWDGRKHALVEVIGTQERT